MGSLLSSPVSEKAITLVRGTRGAHAVGEMQGYRMAMEDAYVGVEGRVGDSPVAIYAVFDGHGGQACSAFLAERFAPHVLRGLQRAAAAATTIDNIDLCRVLTDCFIELDRQFYRMPNNDSGSTCIAAVVFHNQVVVCNVGDSRCILSRNGAAKHCSFDHKPDNLGELVRIHSNGGFVMNNRVNGILALSRAFGDFNFKMHSSILNGGGPAGARSGDRLMASPEKYQVIAIPDIIIHQLTPEDEFLVLACDGIWDCLTPNELIKSIRHLISLGKNLEEVIEIILDRCINMADAATGVGFDNMTMLIVPLFAITPTASSKASVVVSDVASVAASIPSSQISVDHTSPARSNTDSTSGSANVFGDNLKVSQGDLDDSVLSKWLESIKNKVLDEKFGYNGH